LGIARGFTDQRRREHPRPFDAREITIVRDAAHVADPALGIAASQSDEARKKPRERPGAREPVIVDAEPEIAVRAARVRGKQPPIDIAHCLRVFGRTEGMSVLLPLSRAIAERGGAPELGACRLCAPQRHAEQGIDARQLVRRRIEGGRPPDVGACLKHHWGGIGRVARGEVGEIGGGALEISAVQGVQAGTQRRAALQQENDGEDRRHVSAERR
jgi:hypothetical protein